MRKVATGVQAPVVVLDCQGTSESAFPRRLAIHPAVYFAWSLVGHPKSEVHECRPPHLHVTRLMLSTCHRRVIRARRAQVEEGRRRVISSISSCNPNSLCLPPALTRPVSNASNARRLRSSARLAGWLRVGASGSRWQSGRNGSPWVACHRATSCCYPPATTLRLHPWHLTVFTGTWPMR